MHFMSISILGHEDRHQWWRGTYYTHEDENDLVHIVDHYMHEVDICPRVYGVVQKTTSCV